MVWFGFQIPVFRPESLRLTCMARSVSHLAVSLYSPPLWDGDHSICACLPMYQIPITPNVVKFNPCQSTPVPRFLFGLLVLVSDPSVCACPPILRIPSFKYQPHVVGIQPWLLCVIILPSSAQASSQAQPDSAG